MKHKVRRIHFVGIGGVGMSGIAEVLANLGYQVSGSDRNVYPPMSTQLSALGIELSDAPQRRYPGTARDRARTEMGMIPCGHRLAAMGMSRLGPALLHVSPGLGTSKYAPFRFLCRPEATVLELAPHPEPPAAPPA